VTIDEAIKILTDSLEWTPEAHQPDIDNAIKLGIEALKRLQAERRNQASLYNYELVGETKE